MFRKKTPETSVDSKENIFKKKEPYLFIKQRSHFEKREQKKSIPDKSKHHSVTTIYKKLKIGSSAERNTAAWFKIKNDLVLPGYEKRLNRLIVLGGELFRLLDGFLPKYRILEENGDQYPLSKGIKGAQEFNDYFDNHICWDLKRTSNGWEYRGKDFIAGSGRGFLGKYFYYDNDFHAGNAFIDDEHYFKVIDHDRCFAPLSLRWHTYDRYNLKRSYPPPNIISLEDYTRLPLLKDYRPFGWNWDKTETNEDQPAISYFVQLSQQEFFLNEKHFATLKILSTLGLQNRLIQFHLEEKADKNSVKEIIEARAAKMITMCAQSIALLNYLKTNRMNVMQMIIYELNDFFKQNRHYISKDLCSAKKKWHQEVVEVISVYSSVLETLKQSSLNESEKEKLIAFSEDIYDDKKEALKTVRECYDAQKMGHYLKALDKKLEEIRQEEDRIEKEEIRVQKEKQEKIKKEEVNFSFEPNGCEESDGWVSLPEVCIVVPDPDGNEIRRRYR